MKGRKVIGFTTDRNGKVKPIILMDKAKEVVVEETVVDEGY